MLSTSRHERSDAEDVSEMSHNELPGSQNMLQTSCHNRGRTRKKGSGWNQYWEPIRGIVRGVNRRNKEGDQEGGRQVNGDQGKTQASVRNIVNKVQASSYNISPHHFVHFVMRIKN